MSSPLSVYDQLLQFRTINLKLIAKCWNDSDFKQRYLKDPEKALREEFGYDFPFSLRLEAFERCGYWSQEFGLDLIRNEANTLTLVLPKAPPEAQRAEALAQYYSTHVTFLQA
jgi:ribosomally synthesized peptide (two-chain TOMM family)